MGKKQDNDKFYTKPEIAVQCAVIFNEYVDNTDVVEPSAGSGVFAPWVSVMLDIEPEGPDITQQDFFEFDTTKYANYLGNPPFGRNSSLAKQFFNHAAKGKGTIGFIVPLTFRKVSVQNAIDLNFRLMEELILPKNSFTLLGESYHVPCVFQVWKYSEEPRKKIILPTEHEDFHFADEDEYDFAIRRVGGLAGKVLDVGGAPPSHYFIMAAPEVREVMESLYDQFQEVAKNTAGNPSLGKGELIQIYKTCQDREQELYG